jgi:hypothetical protein
MLWLLPLGSQPVKDINVKTEDSSPGNAQTGEVESTANQMDK